MTTDNVIYHIQLRLYLEYVHPMYCTIIPPIRLQRYYSSYYCTALVYLSLNKTPPQQLSYYQPIQLLDACEAASSLAMAT